MTEPCIIEVARNGNTAKAANPRVPRTPSEITTDALDCIAAGASVIHNHTDDSNWVTDGVQRPAHTSRHGRR